MGEAWLCDGIALVLLPLPPPLQLLFGTWNWAKSIFLVGSTLLVELGIIKAPENVSMPCRIHKCQVLSILVALNDPRQNSYFWFQISSIFIFHWSCILCCFLFFFNYLRYFSHSPSLPQFGQWDSSNRNNHPKPTVWTLTLYSWTNCSPPSRACYRIAVHKTVPFLLGCDEKSSPCGWPRESGLSHACNFSSLKLQRSLSNIHHQDPPFSTPTLCTSPLSSSLTCWCREGSNADILGLKGRPKECEMTEGKLGWNSVVYRGSGQGLRFPDINSKAAIKFQATETK